MAKVAASTTASVKRKRKRRRTRRTKATNMTAVDSALVDAHRALIALGLTVLAAAKS